jgi:hypothetical protein
MQKVDLKKLDHIGLSFFYFDCQKYLCKIEVSNSKS